MTTNLTNQIVDDAKRRFDERFNGQYDFNQEEKRQFPDDDRQIMHKFLETEIRMAVERVTEEIEDRLIDKWQDWGDAKLALSDIRQVLSTLTQPEGEDK